MTAVTAIIHHMMNKVVMVMVVRVNYLNFT
jgi:hypothetical protein